MTTHTTAPKSAPTAADAYEPLRPHIICLREGKIFEGGLFQMRKDALDRIFTQDLPAYVEESRKKGRAPRLVLYAHGGLVDEAAGLASAAIQIPFWRDNGAYPLFFVWETGFADAFWPIIRERVFGREEDRDAVSFGLDIDWGELLDPIAETVARSIIGVSLWEKIKNFAAIASANSGGGTAVARRLAEFLTSPQGADAQVHAVGHSAGSNFHSFLLPRCLAQPNGAIPAIRSLHFLAPAMTVSEFQARLLPLLGRGIDRLTIYTMTDQAEREDVCEFSGRALYHKSLLYLIFNALEREKQTPLLGLERSLRGESPPEVRRGLGLEGSRSTYGRVLFSPTPDSAPADARTQSRHHGGFDDDPPTMESIARQILESDIALDADGQLAHPFPHQETAPFAASAPARIPVAAMIAGGPVSEFDLPGAAQNFGSPLGGTGQASLPARIAAVAAESSSASSRRATAQLLRAIADLLESDSPDTNGANGAIIAASNNG